MPSEPTGLQGAQSLKLWYGDWVFQKRRRYSALVFRTTAPNATLVNSFMVRYLDFNDLGGGGHNSDSISAILAVAERDKANGRDFLTSVVISYEIGARFNEGMAAFYSEDRSWQVDIRGGVNMPQP